MANQGPIGVFDSGVGGLSILKEVRKLLPNEDLVYFADSAHCPYGGKEPEIIRARALAIGRFLQDQGTKLLVVASNTTSASGLEAVRDTLNLPVVGVEPAVKPATELTPSGKVGVLATGVTLNSTRFSALVDRYCDGVEVITQPCPGLVEMVEDGRLDEAEPLLANYLSNLIAQDCRTIVLGCTHYPFLRNLVEKIVGPEVKVIDSGEAVARQVARVIEQLELAKCSPGLGWETFYTSGEPEKVTRVTRLLWGSDAVAVQQSKV